MWEHQISFSCYYTIILYFIQYNLIVVTVYCVNTSDKRWRESDIGTSIFLSDRNRSADLSDFSEGEQFDFPTDEFDKLLDECELFGIDDSDNTE